MNPDLEFSSMMMRAYERCSNLASSEKIMGYTENHQVYLDIAYECRNATAWVSLYRNQRAAESSGERRTSPKAKR